MSKSNEEKYSANALVRGLEIIKLFNAERPSLSLAEIAKLLGVSRTVPYRLLYTLESLGYLRQNEQSKRYELTPKVLELGFSYLSSIELTELAQPYLEKLRDEYNVSCHLSTLEETDVVYIGTATLRGVTALNVNVGLRINAHKVANGRVLLAHQDESYIDEYYHDTTIEQFTEGRFDSVAMLKSDLQKVKERGYAVSIGEFLKSINSIAVPIFGRDDKIIAAVNVVGTDDDLPTNRLTGEVLTSLKEVGEALSNHQRVKT